MLVGGIRTLTVAEEILDRGQADLIALCRPLIREPNLVKRWAGGDIQAAACISCNGCYAGGIEGRGVDCAILAKSKAGSSDSE